MLKILINGICGKMGTEVANLVSNSTNMHLLGGLDSRVLQNVSYPIYTTVNDVIEKPNVIIDFSTPSATIHILSFCLQYKIPIVIATTGFSIEEQSKIMDASSQIPIFQSGNMSYEITLVSKIVAELSKQLPNSDIEIIETHHHNKKDSPSRYCFAFS